MARRMIDLISDVKGENIVLLDLREVTPIADYFIICSGSSERQLRAIVDRVAEEIKHEFHTSPLRIEGQSQGGWVLLDYGSIVIHAFLPEQREYYQLEAFWHKGKTLLRLQ
jgi:ribosome-associated protein